MAPVKFKIHYIKGKENARVDALSRRPNYAEDIELKEYRIFKIIFYFLIFLNISRPFPPLSHRDHGTGNGSLCPVPISRRDGIPTWKTRPFPSRGEA